MKYIDHDSSANRPSVLSDQEMEEWVQDIGENTHYKDGKTLNLKLYKAMESHERSLQRPELNI